MTITGVCTFTYWPGLTIRCFTWPAKGARITLSCSFLSGERHRRGALGGLRVQGLDVLHGHVVGGPGRVVAGLGLVEGRRGR